MAVTSSNDDGFREIQLNGKQLVFLFMAVTVVLVVTFLTGVLVGRGVRAERAEAAQTDVLNEAPAAPQRADVAPPADADPTKAAPPAAAEDGGDADPKGASAPEPTEEPPVAVKRSALSDTAATPQPKPVESAKAAPPSATPAPAPVKSVGAMPPPAVSSALAASTLPAAAASNPRSGYAVQVAAVNVRGEADVIVKRLSGRGYSAYIEDPRGNQKMFRVRVGTFKTRREAQTIADKLKKEEKFKPWVTR